MATEYRKILHFSAAVESTTIAEARRWFHAEDTGRMVITRQDGVTRDYFWNSVSMAGQSSTTGAALIGSAGISGITPVGGSLGGAGTLLNMLGGIALSVILKSPYNSSINTIQPPADYVPFTIKGFAGGVSNLFSLQTSSTAVAWFDNAGNLTLSQSVAGNVALSIINSNNSSGSANAKLVLSVGGSSAGDPFVNYSINGGQQWSEGIDRSDSFKYKISESNALGTNDALTITPSGAMVLNRAVTCSFTIEASGNIYTRTDGTGFFIQPPASTAVGMYRSGTNLGFKGAAGTDCLVIDAFYQATFSGDVVSSKSNSGGNAVVQANNSSNTSNSGARLEAVVAGAGGGDPHTHYQITGGTNWTTGGHNAGSDSFKISKGDALGTNDALVIDTTLNVSILGGDLSVSRANAGATVTLKVENTDTGNTSSLSRLFINNEANGDSKVHYRSNGGSYQWAEGIDASDSGKFKICNGSVLGTNDYLIIDTAGKVGIGMSPTDEFNFAITKTSQAVFKVQNDSNTNTAAHMRLMAQTGGGSGGDPLLLLRVLSGADWSIGIHNSDGDKLKFGMSSSVGTSTALTIDSSLLCTFGASVTCGGGTGTYFQFPRGTSHPSSPALGYTYINTIDGHYYTYTGSAWFAWI